MPGCAPGARSAAAVGDAGCCVVGEGLSARAGGRTQPTRQPAEADGRESGAAQRRERSQLAECLCRASVWRSVLCG